MNFKSIIKRNTDCGFPKVCNTRNNTEEPDDDHWWQSLQRRLLCQAVTSLLDILFNLNSKQGNSHFPWSLSVLDTVISFYFTSQHGRSHVHNSPNSYGTYETFLYFTSCWWNPHTLLDSVRSWKSPSTISISPSSEQCLLWYTCADYKWNREEAQRVLSFALLAHLGSQ